MSRHIYKPMLAKVASNAFSDKGWIFEIKWDVDGEIIVMREGVPDFQTLLERGQAVSKGEIERQSKNAPAEYVIFDVLEKDGKSLTGLPLMERKKILKESLKEGIHIVLSDFIEEKGEAYYKLILEKGLE